MATILKGKNKGREVKLHQWCNDWFMVTGLPLQECIISPTNIKLTEAEIVHVVSSQTGMFGLYELREDGTFKRRKNRG